MSTETKETKKKEPVAKKAKKAKLPNVISLLKAGVHFGHKTCRWHPSMKKFIFAERKGIHIIDLKQTLKHLELALDFIKQTVSRDGVILLVSTKEQARPKIKEIAEQINMPYVNEKWIGGTITNWPIIKKQILKLKKAREDHQKGEWSKYTKKEQLLLEKELKKLEQLYGGIAILDKLPDALFILDCKEDKTAVREANLKNIPIIGLGDTNVDVGKISYPIPANDDAIKSVNLILDLIKETILTYRNLKNFDT
jgi:small subunit ribosomal protein S2